MSSRPGSGGPARAARRGAGTRAGPSCRLRLGRARTRWSGGRSRTGAYTDRAFHAAPREPRSPRPGPGDAAGLRRGPAAGDPRPPDRRPGRPVGRRARPAVASVAAARALRAPLVRQRGPRGGQRRRRAGQGRSRGHGLVNAVLRRANREAAGLLAGLDDATPAGAAVSPLDARVDRRALVGGARSRGDCAGAAGAAATSRPSTLCARTRSSPTPPALAAALPVAASVPGDPPEAVIALERFDAHASEFWRAGAFMPQSRAAMLVAHAVDPQPGDRVLDLCAAPGGKTTHLAALCAGRPASVTPSSDTPGRARSLGRTAERMRAANVVVTVGDAGAAAGRGVRPGRTRPAVLGPRYAPVAAGPPLAGVAAARLPASSSSRPGYCPRRPAAPRPGRDARLLDLHHLACRKRTPDRRLPR